MGGVLFAKIWTPMGGFKCVSLALAPALLYMYDC